MRWQNFTESGSPLSDGSLFNRDVTPVYAVAGGVPPLTVQAKLDGMDKMVAQKEEALHDAQARYETACKTFAEETAELVRRAGGRAQAARDRARALERRARRRREQSLPVA